MVEMEQEKENRFIVQSSWFTKGKEILSAVSCGDFSEKCEDEDYSSLVELETCVFLAKPETDENLACTIQITCRDISREIRKISIVSEARIIELYGLYGEYIRTIKAEKVDEIEGMVINVAHAETSPLKEIMLKFAGIKNDTGMWLYGIRILLNDVLPTNNGTSKVNYKNVEERLKASKIPITEKAERCKKFLQQYTNITNSYIGKQPDPQMLLKLLEEDCMAQLRPLNNAGKNVSKYLSNLLPNLTNKKENGASGEAGLNQGEVDCILDLKQYIDTSILKLETRITEYFDKRLKEFETQQDEKLDKIMLMLKER